MTYFGFLARYVLPPLLIFGGLVLFDRQILKRSPAPFDGWPPLRVLAGLVIVAVVYTTPWDNYLVASGVWWYDPALVTGITLGYVPLEEYTFFVLQTLLTGFYLLWLMGRLPGRATTRLPAVGGAVRPVAVTGAAVIWAVSTIVLFSGWAPARYLTLILSWALIPVLIQLAFGADILWRHRRLLFWGIVPSTLYLAAADALAIQAGTWQISPVQTLGIFVGGGLPLEEFTFFLMTNLLVVFGLTLLLARESHERAAGFLGRRRRQSGEVGRPFHD